MEKGAKLGKKGARLGKNFGARLDKNLPSKKGAKMGKKGAKLETSHRARLTTTVQFYVKDKNKSLMEIGPTT